MNLIRGDREGGGSVCVPVLLPSLHFTRCEDQRRRRGIVMCQINPIKAKKKKESFSPQSRTRQAELTSCKVFLLFQPISPIANKCVMDHCKESLSMQTRALHIRRHVTLFSGTHKAHFKQWMSPSSPPANTRKSK